MPVWSAEMMRNSFLLVLMLLLVIENNCPTVDAESPRK